MQKQRASPAKIASRLAQHAPTCTLVSKSLITIGNVAYRPAVRIDVLEGICDARQIGSLSSIAKGSFQFKFLGRIFEKVTRKDGGRAAPARGDDRERFEGRVEDKDLSMHGQKCQGGCDRVLLGAEKDTTASYLMTRQQRKHQHHDS